ncbi:hypothetical protein [Alkalihalobacillus deserti]|uniref:hypothetical protein n=1 Tax=Alkalihalobacillus deserti TaxID=2879466 RepID=UPI001D1546F4|nr:hypothetical protein [Alkalihalobacillus deserti]
MKKFKMKTVLASVVIASVALTACGNEEEAATEVVAEVDAQEEAKAEEEVEEVEEVEEEEVEGAQADFTYDFNIDGRTLTFDWEPTNFELSVDNYGLENVDGEGHAHLWFKQEGEEGPATRVGINDYNFTKELDSEEFPAGTYEVEIELAENNHAPIEGTQTTVTVVIED